VDHVELPHLRQVPIDFVHAMHDKVTGERYGIYLGGFEVTLCAVINQFGDVRARDLKSMLRGDVPRSRHALRKVGEQAPTR
jgi:hypothetical protein